MTEATVTDRLEVNDPTVEVVTLTVSDGETYISKKFGTITAAIATGNAAVDADLWVTFSGGTATIGWASQTDKLLTLLLYGRK